jgi:hypothetical protein
MGLLIALLFHLRMHFHKHLIPPETILFQPALLRLQRTCLEAEDLVEVVALEEVMAAEEAVAAALA